MKREAIFKARRMDNGKWVRGYYFQVWTKGYILKGMAENGSPNMIEVEPSTLCRRTGLYDKTGGIIWENDILRCHGNDKDLLKVVLGNFNVINVETLDIVDNVYGWHTEVIETDALSRLLPYCLAMPLNGYYIRRCEGEVIGNVYDNKNLLEEVK